MTTPFDDRFDDGAAPEYIGAMRTLAFVLRVMIGAGLCMTAGCGGGGGAAHEDMSKAPDMAFASSCGFPGDKAVNSLGVGQFCQMLSDCEAPAGSMGWKAALCSTIGDATSHFCTFVCDATMAGQCGSGASCVCNGIGCGCTPAACVPPDGGA